MTVRVGISGSGSGEGRRVVERLRARIAESFATQRALRGNRGRIRALDLGSPRAEDESIAEPAAPRAVVFIR